MHHRKDRIFKSSTYICMYLPAAKSHAPMRLIHIHSSRGGERSSKHSAEAERTHPPIREGKKSRGWSAETSVPSRRRPAGRRTATPPKEPPCALGAAVATAIGAVGKGPRQTAAVAANIFPVMHVLKGFHFDARPCIWPWRGQRLLLGV